MKTALIGYTGFVGSNLARQHDFDDLYNSQNIHEIEGKEYDLVISAANRAEMWRINQEPEIDRAEIDEFIDHLGKVKIAKLVLISTVGVYKNPSGADESTPIDTEGLLPYGLNRYYLEQYCRNTFDTLIVRLPGLFGPGLKKNVIFDLLHENNIEKIHADGTYQYYYLENIWNDIGIALENKLPIINFATEPVSTREVAEVAFSMTFDNRPEDVSPAYWDMHSKFGSLYGNNGSYIVSKERELEQIKQFVNEERS